MYVRSSARLCTSTYSGVCWWKSAPYGIFGRTNALHFTAVYMPLPIFRRPAFNRFRGSQARRAHQIRTCGSSNMLFSRWLSGSCLHVLVHVLVLCVRPCMCVCVCKIVTSIFHFKPADFLFVESDLFLIFFDGGIVPTTHRVYRWQTNSDNRCFSPDQIHISRVAIVNSCVPIHGGHALAPGTKRSISVVHAGRVCTETSKYILW